MDILTTAGTDSPLQHPREGWDDPFRQMAARGDDRLLDDVAWPLSEWETLEWDWSEIVQDEPCILDATDCVENTLER